MMQCGARIKRLHFFSHLDRHCFQVILILDILQGWRCSSTVSSDARPQFPLGQTNGSAGQVSKPALEPLLVVADDEFIVVVGIPGQTTLEDEEEAYGIDAEPVNGEEWVNHVARRLGHLFPVHGPVAMYKQVAR